MADTEYRVFKSNLPEGNPIRKIREKLFHMITPEAGSDIAFKRDKELAHCIEALTNEVVLLKRQVADLERENAH